MPQRRPSARATIITVAKACGVTDGTVSRALRGDSRVRPETRAKVLAAAERLGYRPNLQARALKQGRNGLIGVIWDSGTWVLHNDHFGRLLAGFAEAATEDGRRLLLSFPSTRPRDENPLHDDVRLGGLSDLTDGTVDAGVVVGGREPKEQDLRLLRRSGVPVVWLDPNQPVAGFSQVHSGLRRRSESAGRLLATMGHRRIGSIGLFKDSPFNQVSLEGLKAGAGAGVKVLGLGLDHWDLSDPLRLAPLLDQCLREGCTAILSSNSEQGGVLLDLVQQRGIKVPQQLSLLTIGPLSPGHRAAELPQSSLECDLLAGGREAYRLLRLAMEGGPIQSSELKWEMARGGKTLAPPPSAP